MKTQRLPRPCDPATALARIAQVVGVRMPYVLGTGDYSTLHPLVPWTTRKRDGRSGADCATVMSFGYAVPRHRPGYNIGSWATVSDDINTNSGIEDADHEQDLWTEVIGDGVESGDILCYPTIRLKDAHGDWIRGGDGEILTWIGHAQMVAEVPKGWKRSDGWHALTVYQCFGPDGRMPAFMKTDGHAMDLHDAKWPKREHCARVLRSRP